MEFVKNLNFFGVEAKEIPCLKGEGVPTTTTKGAIGCLYMDTLTGDIYKCVSVEDNSYAWNTVADKIDAVIVEQTYDSESENAQSGKAVAEAVENISALDHSTIETIAHRGYSVTAPENTIPAYTLAKKKGFKYVECDVAFTADGVPVLLHDETIDRTSDGTGKISELNYADLLQYDFGSWKSTEYAGTKIPTLAEFLDCCKGLGLCPYIELKQSGQYTQEQIASIVDMVKSMGMQERVAYASFSPTFLGYVKSTDSKAKLYLAYYAKITQATVDTLNSLKTGENEVVLGIQHSCITPLGCELCKTNDIPIYVWTIDNEDTVRNINDYVSCIVSNKLNAGKVMHDTYMDYTPSKVAKITNDLYGSVTSNNNTTSIQHGDTYNTTLNPPDLPEFEITFVKIKMGHIDITSGVYSNETINIPSVSGDVEIITKACKKYAIGNLWQEDGTANLTDLLMKSNISDAFNESAGFYKGDKLTNRASYDNLGLPVSPGDCLSVSISNTDIAWRWGYQPCLASTAEKIIQHERVLYSDFTDSGWLTTEYTIPSNKDYAYCRICISRQDDADFDLADLGEVIITKS